MMMKRILFLASLLLGLALAFAPVDAPRVIAQTFPGQTSPGYVPIGQGPAQIKWLPITGCTLTSPGALSCPYSSGSVPWANVTSPPTTLAGYGITNARTQDASSPNFWVNGNAVATNGTTAAGNATLHFAAGSGTTNNTTAAGNAVLHFSTTPAGIYIGATITDTTASVIPAATTVIGVTSTTVTISANVTGGGVGNGDTIQWSLSTFFVGQQITDTTASVIPANTTILSVTPTTVVLSANVTGGGVGNGDTIKWQAACGTTGASTCGFGNDSNNCATPATACLTLQAVLNLIGSTKDLTAGGSILLAHGASQNYAGLCENNGAWVGTAVIGVYGDSTALTAVTMVDAASARAMEIKDGCTLGMNYFALADNAAQTGSGHIVVGATGNSGHLDFRSLTFYGVANGTMLSAGSLGTVAAFGSNVISGNAIGAFSEQNGGVIDLAGVPVTVTGTPNFTTAFNIMVDGGVIKSTSGITGASTGARCSISGPVGFGGNNPNAQFPGNSDCVINTVVGAIGTQVGSGGSSTISYGTSGQALMSGGGSSNLNTWGSLRQTIGSSTGSTLAQATTVYNAIQGGVAGTQTNSVTVSMGGTLKNMYYNVGNSPAAGQTVTVTLMTGTYAQAVAGTMTASGVTCTITSATTQCSDTSDTVTIAAGNVFSWRVVTSATTGNIVGHSWAVEFDNP